MTQSKVYIALISFLIIFGGHLSLNTEKANAHWECPIRVWGTTNEGCPHRHPVKNTDAEVGCPQCNQKPPSTPPPKKTLTKRVYFQNKCRYPIRLAVRFYAPSGSWITDGWWSFAENDSALLLLHANKQFIRIERPSVYYFAETVLESSPKITWTGDQLREFNGRTLPMRFITLSTDDSGDYVLSINCHQYN